MSLKILHTQYPNFYFDPAKMEVVDDLGEKVGVMGSNAFESIGAFFQYAEQNFDCVVLLMGLKSFGDLVNISSSKPDAEPVSVSYWGYKSPNRLIKSKNSLKNFF